MSQSAVERQGTLKGWELLSTIQTFRENLNMIKYRKGVSLALLHLTRKSQSKDSKSISVRSSHISCLTEHRADSLTQQSLSCLHYLGVKRWEGEGNEERIISEESRKLHKPVLKMASSPTCQWIGSRGTAESLGHSTGFACIFVYCH